MFYRKNGDKRRLLSCYKNRGHVYYDEDKQRLIRYNIPGHRAAKYFRRLSNKKVRKFPYAMNGGLYRKVYDYWWEIY